MRRAILLLLAFSAAAFSQTPTISSVVNAASFGPQLCPGLIATVFGANFGTSATGVTVSVGGKQGYVYSPVTAGQLNIQIPFEVPVSTTPTTLTVTVGGVSSAPFSVTISAVSPYFNTQGGTGAGLAQVFDATAGNALVTAAAPAHAGDTLVADVVGLGVTTPATPTNPTTGAPPATAQVSPLPKITIGGVSSTVSFAGVTVGTFAGLYQVNFTVPPGVSGTVPIVISMDGVLSTSIAVNSAVVTIAVVSTLTAPTVTGVQNGASFGTQLCPGLLAIVYGSGFGNVAANLSVSVGSKPGYVASVTPNQLLVQIPFEASTGATSMVVTVSGTASPAFNITLSATSPAFDVQGSAATGLADVIENSTYAIVSQGAPAHPGDGLFAYALGLGPTTPPSPTGVQTASNPVATLPTVTVGGVSATNVTAGLTMQYVGTYQVNFTVPPGVQGTVPLVISVGGASSITTVTIAVAGISYVENNATNSVLGSTSISPGSIATVFANSIGASSNVLSALFPAVSSQGVQVTFNGTPAPMFDVVGAPLTAGNPQQIDILVPSNLPTSGTVNVQLTTSTALYPNFTVNMVPSNPAFYRLPDPKVPTLVNVIAQFANTAWLALPVSTTTNIGLPACTSNTNVLSVCGQPATIGDTLVLYATGLGLATPSGAANGTPLATGQVAPVNGSPLYETPTLPVVTIGGIQAKVLFSGIAPGTAGEYQVDVTVPSGLTNGDNIPVSLSILGATDSSTTISIQPRPGTQSPN